MNDDPFLTIFDLAERWHLTPRAVRDEVNRKRLVAAKIGGQWLVRPSDVLRYEQSRLNVTPIKKRTSPPKKRAS